MGELFGALGLAWPRLLLYPGGLFALVGARLLSRWLARCRAGNHGSAVSAPQPAPALSAIAPLAVLTLLPLAPARSFPFGLDLVLVLALIEWPRLARAGALIGAGETRSAAPSAHGELPPSDAPANTRQAADPSTLVADYRPLLFATLGLTAATGSLELTALLRAPEGWAAWGLLLTGAGLWFTALPRLLARELAGVAGELRALGLLLVGALPILGVLAATMADLVPDGAAGWLLPPAAMVIAAALLGAAMRAPQAGLRAAQVSLTVTLLGLLAAQAASTVL